MKVYEPYLIQLSIDICDIFKERTKSFLTTNVMPVIFGYIIDLFHSCPYEKVFYS
jgi:hypothetical protein